MASAPEKDLEIDSPLFYKKIGRIYSEWEVPFTIFNAIGKT